MLKCEKCSIEHVGKYGSGRFCSKECSKSFSSLSSRDERNRKTSETLKRKFFDRKQKKICPICSESFLFPRNKNRITCSRECNTKFKQERSDEIKKSRICSPATKEKLSIARTRAIIEGKSNSHGIKCTYLFDEKEIKCDSKIEYACLNYFETVLGAKSIERCKFIIQYDDNGQKRRYIPDFLISTQDACYLVECKSFVGSKKLNEKWRKYNELSLKKKECLILYANSNGFIPFWFTKNLHIKYYNSLKL